MMRDAAAELTEVAGPSTGALDPVVQAITEAHRVMLYGCGREGLMMRALAMRLHHLGLDGVHAGRHDRVPVGPRRPVPVRRGPRRARHGLGPVRRRARRPVRACWW